jgi:hypothetical protein
VTYVGHVISAEGIKPDLAKTPTVENWPQPKTLKQLRSFLGLSKYFRKFIQDYSKMVLPLTDLTKNATNKFMNITHKWDGACQQAFQNVKYALTHALVLAMPDFTQPFEFVADARGDRFSGALGAVLLHNGHPIAFESRKFTLAEVCYTTTEQELLAVVHALKTWRCYLEGAVKVTVVTNHCPNTFFSTLPELNRRQARWLETLQVFDFDWAYRPCRTNVADPLSRIPVPDTTKDAQLKSTALCSRAAAVPPAGVVAATALENTVLVKLIQISCESDSCYHDTSFIKRHKLSFADGLWWKASKIAVPENPSLRTQIFLGAHEHVYAGHFGEQKTEELMTRHFWFPGVREFVQSRIRQCDCCQRNKSLNKPHAGKLMPLPIPGYMWQTVSMDFITDLPKASLGYDAVCVFVDKLTKLVHIAPTTSSCDAPELAQIFLREVCRYHGFPQQILHDRGQQFMSQFFARLCQGWGIQQLPSSAYHPQTDGQTERVNRILEDTLRHFTNAEQTNWDDLLPMVEFAINNAQYASTGFTPFYLNYGRHPETPLSLQVPTTDDTPEFADYGAPAVTKFTADLQAAVQKASGMLQAAQNRQKAYADQKRAPDPDYAVGTEVLLSGKHIPLKHPGSYQLLPRWLGPFRVAKRISSVAF